MPASKSSKPQRNSKTASQPKSSGLAPELVGVLLLLAALSALSLYWVYLRGYTLYYGDAAAHLNIARRMVDYRAYTMKLLGTVWLPLPHAAMSLLARSDELWRSGLAGAIPMAASFVIAGTFLFAGLRRIFSKGAAALAGTLAFALNPNLLYLQATPMTEAMWFACLAGTLYFSVAWLQTRSWWAWMGASLAVLAGTLTRYEGWILIPPCTLLILWTTPKRRILSAAAFGLIASAGAIWWLAYNWWFWGDALEFYRGQWSAQAIYRRALAQGMQPYPGDHDWVMAFQYFRTAARLCAGAPLFWMGLAGCAAALLQRAWWAVLLTALPPAFYVASMHGSGTPIFVPELWPHSYYNTRYGLALLPLLALGLAAWIAMAPAKWRGVAAVVFVAAAVVPWMAYPHAEGWVCWKESKVNSESRRAWTQEAAQFFRERYRRRDGVFFSFGDLTAVMQQAGIPLRETLHDSSEPLWHAALARPDLFARERWALAIAGDAVADALHRNRVPGIWEKVHTIVTPGSSPVEIYRRLK